MIHLAYEEMANHTDRLSFPYINKVLRSWHEKGLLTPEQVQADKQTRQRDKATRSRSFPEKNNFRER